jgi:hypothetical protein
VAVLAVDDLVPLLLVHVPFRQRVLRVFHPLAAPDVLTTVSHSRATPFSVKRLKGGGLL